ncbi:MAG: hypothetical protein ACFFF4_02575 [Candidatus Thorarchaeota archaeon]
MASLQITRNVIDDQPSFPLPVRVFTSKRCEFSNVALEHVRSVVDSSRYRRKNLKVVEESVDDNVSLLEEFNIMALPMTVIGDFYILGIPSTQDLESILNKVVRRS